jgi:hypothetical protein
MTKFAGVVEENLRSNKKSKKGGEPPVFALLLGCFQHTTG